MTAKCRSPQAAVENSRDSSNVSRTVPRRLQVPQQKTVCASCRSSALNVQLTKLLIHGLIHCQFNWAFTRLGTTQAKTLRVEKDEHTLRGSLYYNGTDAS